MDQELIAYLEERFSSIDQRFSSMDQRFQELQESTTKQIQELREETAQRFDQVDHRLERLETDVRGAYVLVEDVRDKVQFVAEGVANVSEQLLRHREEVSRELGEVKSFHQFSYKKLADRVKNLESGR